MMSNKKEFVITKKFENVFGGDDIESQNRGGDEHFGVSWRIRIFPQGLNFCIDLDCFVDPCFIKWWMEAEIEWKLLSDSGGWKRAGKDRYKIKKNENPRINFDWRRHGDCFSMDSLIVECHVEIIEMKGFDRRSLRRFDQSAAADFSDIVIVVQSEKFYVYDTVASILSLAEKFETPTVLEQCERYLIIETEMDKLKELELAIEYKLDELKWNCLSELDSIEEILNVLPEDLSQLSPAVMAEILKKILSLM
uniref:MATH domain-containing protein n=1 Tax=Caenorhabditis tropicalis TaxID=1561998 RepID=A0A1I7UZM2_9PELO